MFVVDTETTGLDPEIHRPWEVAAVDVDSGAEYEWCWRPADGVVAAATDRALQINGFWARAPQTHDPSVERAAAVEIAALLDGQTIVGSNPTFDTTMLRAWCATWNVKFTVHYRHVDVITMAAARLAMSGEMPPVPWRSYQLSEAVGVPPPADGVRHTALADARWCYHLWQTLSAPAAALAAH